MAKKRKAWPALKAGKHKRSRVDVDWLSQLPEEILLAIVSHLTMKEAARTSLLSHKWKQLSLWQYHPNLNLKGRVNRILEQHLSPTIDGFRVSFDLNHEHRLEIAKWLLFAFTKQVKTLELRLRQEGKPIKRTQYSFQLPEGIHMPLELPRSFRTIKPVLTSLSLQFVDITADAVACVLSSFPFLENLHIEWAYSLTCIRAHSSSVMLKRFKVIHCKDLYIIDLSVPKLLSFSYHGHSIKLNLRDSSSLSVVSIGSVLYRDVMTFAFASLWNYLSQLEYLELEMNSSFECNLGSKQCPMLTNLKHLVLDSWARYDSTLLTWTWLIKASPFLQKLTLKLSAMGCMPRGEIVKHDKHPLDCLKTLEIVGFVGRRVDLEFAMHLLENAHMLEEVTVDTRRPLPFVRKGEEQDRMAQERALKLLEKLPQRARLIFKK